MSREYFLEKDGIGFSKWQKEDIDLAVLLWGDEDVTRLICKSGVFLLEDIKNRLLREIRSQEENDVSYWPIFDTKNDELIGCCGLRLHSEYDYEIGFHLRKKYWGKGIAKKAAEMVIDHAFNDLGASVIFAGHNPLNVQSKRVLEKLGFEYIRDEYYEPTGLYHPSYIKRK